MPFAYFNSTKVQFGEVEAAKLRETNANFNSTKVQFGGSSRSHAESSALISIPLRYNLENDSFHEHSEPINFNSTKVQFGAVKLDRKYHINKGFEKRFR